MITERVILAAKNDSVFSINEKTLSMFNTYQETYIFVEYKFYCTPRQSHKFAC